MSNTTLTIDECIQIARLLFEEGHRQESHYFWHQAYQKGANQPCVRLHLQTFRFTSYSTTSRENSLLQEPFNNFGSMSLSNFDIDSLCFESNAFQNNSSHSSTSTPDGLPASALKTSSNLPAAKLIAQEDIEQIAPTSFPSTQCFHLNETSQVPVGTNPDVMQDGSKKEQSKV